MTGAIGAGNIELLKTRRWLDQHGVMGEVAMGMILGSVVEMVTVGFAWMFYKSKFGVALLVFSALIISVICILENWVFLFLTKLE